MRQGYAGTTASIINSTMPSITAAPKADITGALKTFADARYQAEKQQREREMYQKYLKDEEKNDQDLNDLSEALQSGNDADINSAYARLDPVAFMKNRMESMEEQRQFERQMEMLNRRATLDKELARIKAGGGGLVNINMSNPFERKRAETIAKSMDEKITESQNRINDYDRMIQLLNSEKVKTGGVDGLMGEVLPDFALNQETAELRSIIKKILPQMRAPGSGATSDKDMEVFEQATVGLGKPKEANLNIARGRKIVDENNIAKEELRAEWISSGKGTLTDFDREWKQYLEANPIFSNKDGKLNEKRASAYEWFGGQKQNQVPTDEDAWGGI